MSDPAIEAAQRLVYTWPSNTAAAEAGAREALKPIRELHKPRNTYMVGRVCAVDGHYWPCDTARLIYTGTELGSDAP